MRPAPTQKELLFMNHYMETYLFACNTCGYTTRLEDTWRSNNRSRSLFQTLQERGVVLFSKLRLVHTLVKLVERRRECFACVAKHNYVDSIRKLCILVVFSRVEAPSKHIW